MSKFRILGRDGGKNKIQYDDGNIRLVTDEELAELQGVAKLTPEQRVKKAEAIAEAALRERSEAENERDKLKGDLAVLQTRYETSEADRKELSEKLDESERQNEQLTAKNKELADQLATAQEEIKNLKNGIASEQAAPAEEAPAEEAKPSKAPAPPKNK